MQMILEFTVILALSLAAAYWIETSEEK